MTHSTKQLIAKVAEELFLEKGYLATTLNDIMEATKLSKGAIYHHFSSKKAILDYLIDFKTALLQEKLKNINSNSLMINLNQLFNAFFEYSLQQLSWISKVPDNLLSQINLVKELIIPKLNSILNQAQIKHSLELSETMIYTLINTITTSQKNKLVSNISNKLELFTEVLYNLNQQLLDKQELISLRNKIIKNISINF